MRICFIIFQKLSKSCKILTMLLKICLIFLISFPVSTICPCVSADVYQLKRNYIHPWKLLWKIFETSMKDPWNFFEDPWSFDDRPLNPSWNSPWNWLKRLESPVKHSWNTLEISLWHPWNFPQTPRKFFETPKFPYTSITSLAHSFGACFKHP